VNKVNVVGYLFGILLVMVTVWFLNKTIKTNETLSIVQTITGVFILIIGGIVLFLKKKYGLIFDYTPWVIRQKLFQLAVVFFTSVTILGLIRWIKPF